MDSRADIGKCFLAVVLVLVSQVSTALEYITGRQEAWGSMVQHKNAACESTPSF